MKKIVLKKAHMLLCAVVIFGLTSCKMEEESCEKYPELPASVERKLIKEDVARKLSEGFVERIEKLQSLEEIVHKYADVARKEQSNLQSDALKAIYSSETHPRFELSASSYYTLEEIESYIEYVKREAANQKIKVDGFRIYMGLFPDDENFGNKRNSLTVFITPTGNSAKQEGSFLTNLLDGGSDITTIGSLEYGGNGNPPSTTFPGN